MAWNSTTSGAGELLSKEWKDHFWDFFEVWLRNENKDSDSHTAKDCLKKIVNYGKPLLSEHLASIFEFTLTLRSASPKLVVYQHLAEESLSSFPLADDISSNFFDGGIIEPNENRESKKVNPVLSVVNPRSPGGKCCRVDMGGELFFDVAELQLWLRNPCKLSGDTFQQPELFEFDHIHYDSSFGGPVAILYELLGQTALGNFISPWWKQPKRVKLSMFFDLYCLLVVNQKVAIVAPLAQEIP